MLRKDYSWSGAELSHFVTRRPPLFASWRSFMVELPLPLIQKTSLSHRIISYFVWFWINDSCILLYPICYNNTVAQKIAIWINFAAGPQCSCWCRDGNLGTATYRNGSCGGLWMQLKTATLARVFEPFLCIGMNPTTKWNQNNNTSYLFKTFVILHTLSFSYSPNNECNFCDTRRVMQLFSALSCNLLSLFFRTHRKAKLDRSHATIDWVSWIHRGISVPKETLLRSRNERL